MGNIKELKGCAFSRVGLEDSQESSVGVFGQTLWHGEYQQPKLVFMKTNVEYFLKTTKVACLLLKIFIGLPVLQSLLFCHCVAYYSDISVILLEFWYLGNLILNFQTFIFQQSQLYTDSNLPELMLLW